MQRLNHALSYLTYRLKSKDTHGIHSPFVFKFLNEVVYNYTAYYSFEPLHQYRQSLSLNSSKLNIVDLGAGSSYKSGEQRSVSSVLRQSVKREKYAQLLFRIALWRKPKHIVELGTSLGVTTLYLSYACPESEIITVEGSPEIAEFAKSGFQKFQRQNIKHLTGNFKEQLENILKPGFKSDLVFIDGHHEENATIAYFEQFLKRSDEDSVFILDDIHWSKGMEKAWSYVKEHEKVTLTLDLFEMGIVFFSKRPQKEHFLIRF